MFSPIGRVSAAMALEALAVLSCIGPGDGAVGPGKRSKGIARGRIPFESNEYTTPKPKSASLKRLLRK